MKNYNYKHPHGTMGLGTMDNCGYNPNSCFGTPMYDLFIKVIDGVTGAPIPDVNVYFKHRATRGAATANNGFFSLSQVPEGTDLVLSHVRYEPLQVRAGSMSNVIKLQPKVTQLEEIELMAPKKPQNKIWPWVAMASAFFVLVKKADKEDDQKVKTKA